MLSCHFINVIYERNLHNVNEYRGVCSCNHIYSYIEAAQSFELNTMSKILERYYLNTNSTSGTVELRKRVLTKSITCNISRDCSGIVHAVAITVKFRLAVTERLMLFLKFCLLLKITG